MLQNMLPKLIKAPDASLIYKNQIITSKQLVMRVLSIIQAIKDMACEKTPLTFCLPNCPELFCWQVACFYLGIPIIPIVHECDPLLIEKILQQTKPKYFLTTIEKNKELLGIHFPATCKVKIISNPCHSILSNSLPTYIRVNVSEVGENNPAFITFAPLDSGQLTSVTHSYHSSYDFIEMLSNVLLAKENMIYLGSQSMGQIGGIVTMLMTLLKNGTVILLEKFDLHQYLENLKLYQPTHINLQTQAFYSIMNYPNVDKTILKKLITCFSIGDHVPADLSELFKEKTGVRLQMNSNMTSSCSKIEENIWIESDKKQINVIEELPIYHQKFNKQETIVEGWFRTEDLDYLDYAKYYCFLNKNN